jgi:hypothetical protein
MEALEKQLDENEHLVWTAFETIAAALKIVEVAVINKLQPIVANSRS